MMVLRDRSASLPLTRACDALCLNRSTVYAYQRRAANNEAPKSCRRHSVQPKALTSEERASVIDTLNSAPFVDQPPKSVSAFTGRWPLPVLSEHHAVPRLLATSPNEVWTWDSVP